MSAKRFLNREEILQKQDLVTEDVYIEQWQGYVCVKSLSGKERDKWERDIVEVKGKQIISKDNIRAKLVALSVVDPETLKPLFAPADVEALGSKNAGALDTIYTVASRLSKVSEDDIEELAKNFGEIQGGDSTSV